MWDKDFLVPLSTLFIQSAVSSSQVNSAYFQIFDDELYNAFTNFRLSLSFTLSISFNSKVLTQVLSVNLFVFHS